MTPPEKTSCEGESGAGVRSWALNRSKVKAVHVPTNPIERMASGRELRDHEKVRVQHVQAGQDQHHAADDFEGSLRASQTL